MTAPGASIGNSAAARDAVQDWEAVRDAGDIQFAPVTPPKPPETPDWLKKLGEWLGDALEPLGKALGLSWPALQYILIALAILLVLVLLWALARPLIERWLEQRGTVSDTEDWSPDRGAAIALLEDADRLAQQERFDEAVHLLLQRSVHHIAQARPEWLMPASTVREISGFPMLSDRARSAFAIIATRVERSLFALRSLDEADWTAARAAYSDFALAELTV